MTSIGENIFQKIYRNMEIYAEYGIRRQSLSSKSMYESMDENDLREMAKTSRKDKPVKIAKKQHLKRNKFYKL